MCMCTCPVVTWAYAQCMPAHMGHKRPDRTEVSGAWLAAALDATGVSAAELSRRLELDDSTIYRWKTGRTPMQRVYWLAATQALDLPADWEPGDPVLDSAPEGFHGHDLDSSEFNVKKLLGDDGIDDDEQLADAKK